MTFSIVYGNPGGDLVGVPCAQLSYSDTASPCCGPSNGNLSADPLFVGPFVASTLVAYGYHLRAASPCIDHGPNPASYMGMPCLDLDGRPRQLDFGFDGDRLAQADLGAYEQLNTGRTPIEVQNVRWTGPATLQWNPVPGAAEYHVYRGAIGGPPPRLGYGYYGDRRDDLDPIRTDTTATDASLPPTGRGFFYLVTADATAGPGGAESTLGYGTCAEASNFNPCP